jgi:hypothetical protein
MRQPSQNEVQSALDFAVLAHEGQTDKQGAPYFLHVLRISAAGKSPAEQIVGALHDVIEDTSYTEEDLRSRFADELIDAVVLLTHEKGSPYQPYIIKLAPNALARAVKGYDLIDHMATNHLLPEPMRSTMRNKYTAGLRNLNIRCEYTESYYTPTPYGERKAAKK